MNKTYTVTIKVENEKGETLSTYKHVAVADTLTTIAEKNLSSVVIRMLSDIIQRMKDKKWL